MRLRHVVLVGPSARETKHLHPDTKVTFAPMEALADGLGGLDVSSVRPLSEVASGSYNFFKDGDLLLAKVTPCFENGKKALAEGLTNGIGYATSEVHVIRPRADAVDPRYLLYTLSSEPFRAEGMKSMTGAGGLRRVSENAILNFRLPVPDLPTQRTIAAFLDRETARIDQLIENKQRLVELLGEKLTSEKTALVTRGLNPEAKMTERPVEWLAEAPAHWSVVRMGAIFHEVDKRGEDRLPVLSVSINWGISDRELGDEDRHRIVNHIADRSAYKRVRAGDLVYNMMRAWQGAFGVSTLEGLVSPAYVVARPRRHIHSPYFEPLLRTPMCIEEFRRASKGIADFRQRLYWEYFRQVRVVLPPLDEQEAIAQRVAERHRAISRVAAPVTASIDCLKEYRSALITAAVTGQIDVKTWSRRGEVDRQLDVIEGGVSQSHAKKRVPEPSLPILVAAEIVDRHRQTPRFGRVKFQKLTYLAEAHLGIKEIEGQYIRRQMGPLDENLIKTLERGMKHAGFFETLQDGGGQTVSYSALSHRPSHREALKNKLGQKYEALQKLISLFKDSTTEFTEIVATLFAVWNDALIDGKAPSDEDIIRMFYEDWHSDKKRFKRDQLVTALNWMHRHKLIPEGKLPRTISDRLFV